MIRNSFLTKSIPGRLMTAQQGAGPRAMCRVLRIGLAAGVLGLSACSGLPRTAAVPSDLSENVTVLGLPNERYWPDTQAAAMAREADDALRREQAALGVSGARLPPSYFLAVSGGGENGAFGAGLLCGWEDAGTMPSFKLVTGVSTGAMIAPFAFLGPAYRDQLCALYTSIKPSDVAENRGVYGVLFGEALADTAPLGELIARYVTPQMLADIAAQYAKGRLLLVGTTSLDEQRPVIWNIGAIASSGKPEALDLVRKILRASAAIPGVFPPVMIDVEAGGQRYQEMDVDGGAVAQTFLYPIDLGVRVAAQGGRNLRERHAYIIRNGRLDPNWASVDRQFLPIAGRAIATMIHYSGYNDIVRLYAITQRDGVDYNLAYIEPGFEYPSHKEFDPGYMRALFDYGYARGRQTPGWRKSPPILEDVAIPNSR